MANNHWQVYHRAWSQLTVPLRPHADVIASYRSLLQGRTGRTLLLGVTPELADLMPETTAVDHNEAMITHIWPGNTASRRAVCADWRNSSFLARAFSQCVGDGSLSSLAFDDIATVMRELDRIVARGGRLILRAYLAPDRTEAISGLKEAALSGLLPNFHAFKIRLGMTIAAQRPSPSVGPREILAAFDELFPDREMLPSVTGWLREQIDTIDLYRQSSATFSFPTVDRLLSIVRPVWPNARLESSGRYEMSDCCPLLVADHA
jgi:hypothetical protein